MKGTARTRSGAAWWRARAREHLDVIEGFKADRTTEDYHRAEAAFCFSSAEQAERFERMGGANR